MAVAAIVIKVLRIPNPRQFDVVQANMAIISSGLPNIWGCRIPVYSRLNIPFFRSLLKNYWDSNLCELLEFGFPIGLVRDVNVLANRNHKGAEEYPTDIDKYLEKEGYYNAILGPFVVAPFSHYVVSPLNSVPKKDSNERRVILDLSFPKGTSINDAIPKYYYLGEYCK